MKNVCILILVLTFVLVVISLMLNPIMGIFITCLAGCLVLDWMKKQKVKEDTDEW